jgi:hypothetical protein
VAAAVVETHTCDVAGIDQTFGSLVNFRIPGTPTFSFCDATLQLLQVHSSNAFFFMLSRMATRALSGCFIIRFTPALRSRASPLGSLLRSLRRSIFVRSSMSHPSAVAGLSFPSINRLSALVPTGLLSLLALSVVGAKSL